MKWPVVVSLDSPRRMNETKDENDRIFGMGNYNQGPECVSLPARDTMINTNSVGRW
jgi:hypothetical protein